MSGQATGPDAGDEAIGGSRGSDPADPDRVATLIVDAMNVIGSRPDGWWRDRDGALRRLVARVERYARHHATEVVVVADGRAPSDLPSGRYDGVHLYFARRSGPDAADDRIVELLEAGPAEWVVVTADGGLRERVEERGHRVLGPGRFLRALDDLDPPG